MIMPSAIYTGEVVHIRTKPVRHELRMKLFYLWLDVDHLADLKLRLFSFNRFNLFSVSDRKWGKKDGTPVAAHIRQRAELASGKGSAKSIRMLCLPALLGSVFNPITCYYCFNEKDELSTMVFEVNNTFGQSHSYVVPAADLNAENQKCLHVSPFNKIEGYYHFKAPPPGQTLHMGVQLFTQDSVTLNTWINAKHQPLTDWNLFKAFLRMPLLPMQVLFGIHWQAFKLWRKGLKINATPPAPIQTFSQHNEGPLK
jgi:uncharacterized protein